MNLNSPLFEIHSESKAMIFIPARLQSSRLNQKLLLKTGGMTLLEHTVQNAIRARRIAPDLIGDIILTSDTPSLINPYENSDILTYVSTKPHLNGSSRIQEAMDELINSELHDVDVIMILQADQPAFPAEFLVKMATQLTGNRNLPALTPAMPTEHIPKDILEDSNQVKALANSDGTILNFSRNLNDFTNLKSQSEDAQIMLHVGVYGYQREVFQNIPFQSPSPRAVKENLEQLTPFEKGISFRAMTIPYDETLLGIDTKSDFDRFLNSRFPNEASH